MLTEPQQVALDNFRRHFGRKWKAELRASWFAARIWKDQSGAVHDGIILHSLRNTHGPSWLAKYKGTANKPA